MPNLDNKTEACEPLHVVIEAPINSDELFIGTEVVPAAIACSWLSVRVRNFDIVDGKSANILGRDTFDGPVFDNLKFLIVL